MPKKKLLFGKPSLFTRKTFKPKGLEKIRLETSRPWKHEKEFPFYRIEAIKGPDSIASITVDNTPEPKVKKIHFLWVQSLLQKKAIGKKLMDKALNDLRKLGVKKVIAAVKPTAIGFYEKFGFKDTGETHLMANMQLFPIMELDLENYFKKFKARK